MIERFDRIEETLGRVESKLDNHLERIAKTEQAITHAHGSIKIIFSIFTAMFTALVGGIIHFITGAK